MASDPTSLAGRIVLALIRHALGASGAGLVTQGLLTKAQENQGIGAAMLLITLALTVYDKAKTSAALAAKAAPVNIQPGN